MNRSLIIILFCILIIPSFAGNYYVSPTGSDANAGTTPEKPLVNLSTAITKAAAGDTIWMREGTFAYAATISISKSGSASKKYYLKAWPGEQPILDFSGTSSGKRGITLTGSYWVIRGLTILKAGDNGINISGGAFNLIEECTFAENEDSGLQLGGGAHDNRIINCDSYYNADPTDYGDADGFAPKLDVGSNNYFYGCRAWGNCDDGWDGYMRVATTAPVPTTILENCWTWGNGYLKNGFDPGSQANGNGFKMGGSDNKDLRHHFILNNCLAFDNKGKGFDQNNNKGSMTLYNGTAFRNKGNDFSIPSALAANQIAIVKNCVVAQGNKISLGSFVVQEANSWNGGFSVTSADFLSLDTTGISGPRKADGSLPDLNFVRLAPGSDLINAGVDVGLPYKGTKPDLGCFETDETTGTGLLMKSENNPFDLKIYTTESAIKINFNPSGETRFNADLISLNGMVVWSSREFPVHGGRSLITIDRSRLPAGIYLFRMVSGDKLAATKLILP